MATFLSVLFGGLVTWLVSWFYYKRAGDELRQELGVLKKANIVIAYLLEHPDADVEIKRDEAGNPTGVIVSARMQIKLGNASMKAKGTVGDPP